jgi:hypothetical protein
MPTKPAIAIPTDAALTEHADAIRVFPHGAAPAVGVARLPPVFLDRRP